MLNFCNNKVFNRVQLQDEPLQHVHRKTVVRTTGEVLDLIDEIGNIEGFEQILKQQIVQKSMNINPFLCGIMRGIYK